MYSFGYILNQGVFDQEINFNDPGRSDNLRMNVTIRYRLYNGGRDRAGIDAAEAGRRVSLYELETVRSELSFQVVKTFFTTVQAEEMLKARRSSAAAIDTSVQVAKARWEAGDMLRADLLDLQVRQSEAYEDLLHTRHGVDLAMRALLNLLGLEEGKLILIHSYAQEQLIPKNLSFERRPELKQLTASIEEAEALLQRSKGEYYPAVEAFAGYQMDKGYHLDGSGDSWQAGLHMNMNIFSGKETKARIAAAEAHLKALKERQRKILLEIKTEVERARLAVEEAQQRIVVTEKMVEQAEESTALHRERFKAGLLLPSELIDVEDRFINAKARRILAVSALRIAVAELLWALGLNQYEAAAPDGNTVE